MLFTLKQPPLLSSLLPPEPARSIPNPDPPTPLAQVAEEAMVRACATAPILIHPEHLSPSLPIGERRMGGVRGRPISSQPGTSEPWLPKRRCQQAANFTPSLHATAQPRWASVFLLQPPPSASSPSYLPLGARRKGKD